MKKQAAISLMLIAILLGGCASINAQSPLKRGGEFVVDGAVAYAGYKGFQLHKMNPPKSPDRSPDAITEDGARIWKDKHGRIQFIKVFSGPVYEFGYDKHGQIDKVVEPTGAVMKRTGNREWLRTDMDGKRTPVYGIVMIGNANEVRYLFDDGSQAIHNGNGYVVETERVGGVSLITRVVDTKGRLTEINYDADNNPFSIKTFDGFVLSQGDDGKWYRALPGTARETAVPYTVARDPDTGYVLVRTPDTVITYADSGVSEERISPEKK